MSAESALTLISLKRHCEASYEYEITVQEIMATMVSAITGNQSVSTWRGAQSLFVPCDIMV